MKFSSEKKIIDRIQRQLGSPSRRVKVGIGDDAAVVQAPQGHLVSTVDMLIEDVHFKRAWIDPKELGHKALAVNLSDIAAMGAEPLYCLVSMAIPDEVEMEDIAGFYEGLQELAGRFEVDVVGGNLSRSPRGWIIDVCVNGEAAEPALLRSGCQEGNWIAVTGSLGGSAAGLQCLEKVGRDATQLFPTLTARHLKPTPRIREAQALMETKAVRAMVDVSDGLASEVHHLMRASETGALMDESQLPILEDARKACAFLEGRAEDCALFGGEDYELLMAVDPDGLTEIQSSLRALGTKLTVIGEVKPPEFGVQLQTSNGIRPLESRGWDPFHV